MDRWRGKVAVVTGASGGIGAALAEKLVEEGLQVVAFARRIDKLKEVRDKTSNNVGELRPKPIDPSIEKHLKEGTVVAFARRIDKLKEVPEKTSNNVGELRPKPIDPSIEKHLMEGTVAKLARRIDKVGKLPKRTYNSPGKLHPIQVDLTNEKELLEAFQWIKENLGPIHILVNNASINIQELLSEGSTENWTKVFQANVILCSATLEALKDMKENNVDGHIINMNSVSSHVTVKVPDMAMYVAYKQSVRSLTESLRFKLASSGSKTKVTSISPGPVDSGMMSADSRKLFENMKILQTKDIVDAITYVLSTPPHVQV